MSYKELNFNSWNLTFALSEVKDMFQMHFDRGCRYVTKRVYEKILAVDFDSFISADRHERTYNRRGQRNGYRHRGLLTTTGLLDLKVPRDRNSQFKPRLFKRFKRVDKNLDNVIRAMFLSGLCQQSPRRRLCVFVFGCAVGQDTF